MPQVDMRNPALRFMAGGGEMGGRTRAFNWPETVLGPVAAWPQSLKTAVNICLASRYPIVIWWGCPEYTMFYNDAYISFLGTRKHPGWLGRSGRECWREIWPTIGPMLEGVFATGQATWSEDLLLLLDRNAPREEAYFTFSYSPIQDEEGKVGGIFCACYETTGRVIGERRLRSLKDLAKVVAGTRAVADACEGAAQILGANRADIPFALVYLLEPGGQRATLAAESGLERNAAATPPAVDLNDPEAPWPFSRVARIRNAVEVDDLAARFGPLPGGAWPEPSRRAVALPLAKPGRPELAGFLVAGISPRLVFNDDYKSFMDLLAAQVATTIANARAHEEARQRAEALAELDHAKNAFFSNVSHEFRTPLTLMLGPLEDALADTAEVLPHGVAAALELAHRNGLRLLKLVNTLLDFSRLEAGRAQANREPTDLSACTAELASQFRAAVEKAGLTLVVRCPALPEPVDVDREMWEKIVLNLLSNSLKFTFEGTIEVGLRSRGSRVELCVSDTGIGISEAELPRIFERFHRVPGARSRTHEGTGIGLALVQELVRLHGGEITVRSQEGLGASFTVNLPSRAEQAPAGRAGAARATDAKSRGAAPFVEEALQWLAQPPDQTCPDGEGRAAPDSAETPLSRPRILLAEDNRDMRAYICRLLVSRGYEVVAAPDGRAALESARSQKPDLILSDVMMPLLDGVQLLAAVRGDESLKSVPFMVLSARAGEEARVDGILRGADDYLTKPFNARELLARVGTNLKLSEARRLAMEEVSRARHFLERIATAVPDLLFVYDIIEGRNLYANRSLENVLGYTVEAFQSIPGNLAEAIVHPEDLAAVREWYSRFDTAMEGEILELEQRLRRADGSYCWLGVRAALFERAPDGRAQQIIGVATDITEKRRAEGLRAHYAAIVESSDDAILSKDLDGVIRSWNRGAERLFGYRAREAVGRPVTMLIPPDRANEEPFILDRVRNGQPVEHYETVRRRKDGALVEISLTVSPIKDAAGKVIGASKIARDITDRRNAERGLREAQTLRSGELEKLVAERTASLQKTVAELEHFSYTITHDMRGPLRALQGYGSILLGETAGRSAPETADYLRRIVKAAGRMDALILDSLQYAKIVREQIPLYAVDPGSILREILDSYPGLQPPHAEVQVVGPLPAVIANDAGLGQCFSNLLVNAVKFVKPAQAPRVRVWAETRGEAVRFWFEDNGIGIPPEYHERIFGMFQKLDKTCEGTGIGLALVRKTSERMQGRAGVESAPGEGSRFWLEFKRAHPPDPVPPNQPNVTPC